MKCLIKCLVPVFLYTISQATFAECTFHATSHQTIIPFILPASISVPQDAPIGTIIYHQDTTLGSSNSDMICTTRFYRGSIDSKGHSAASGIYPIGDTGIAWQWTRGSDKWKQYPSGAVLEANDYSFSYTNHGFDLIKIGDIKDGATIPAGTLGYYQADTLRSLAISVSAMSVVAASCQTPASINADLGQLTLSEIESSDMWSTVGIQLTNCPKGINSVRLSLIPTASSPALSAAQGIISLNSHSTARGIAVQIKNPDHSIFDITKKLPFTNFTPGTDTILIELFAKLVRQPVTTEITPGTANSEILFRIEYL